MTTAGSGSVLARWLGGWRVALRMARRDIRAHRGRSALIAAMVAVPVALMVGGLTLVTTQANSPQEAIPGRFGAAQAVIAGASTVPLLNNDRDTTVAVACPDSQNMIGIDGSWPGIDGFGAKDALVCADADGRIGRSPARVEVPGLAKAADIVSVASALQKMTGDRLVPVAHPGGFARLGSKLSLVSVLAIDGADPAARGMTELVSGRWPRVPGEYVVTTYGQRLGLPASGSVRFAGGYSTWTTELVLQTPELPDGKIVGVADIPRGQPEATPALIAPAPKALAGTQFLLYRDAPVTASEVRQWGAQGVAVLSRDLVRHPGQLPAPAHWPGSMGNELFVGTVLLGLALLVESSLLAGPAFAVIAARQRRTLALAACQGAGRAQLRRTLLAQALLLGVGAALVAVPVSIAAAALAIPIWEQIQPSTRFGPFEVPALEVGTVVLCAMIAAVISALIPARGLTRLDVVAALRADVVSPRPHPGVPVLGLVLFGAGVGLLAWATTADAANSTYALPLGGLVGGGIFLVVGALCLTPLILASLARLADRAPVALRLATRDAARQRGRAIPTVAAIMAGAILLSGFGISGVSADAQGRRSYLAQGPYGQAVVQLPVSPVPPEETAEGAKPGPAPTPTAGNATTSSSGTAGATPGASASPQTPPPSPAPGAPRPTAPKLTPEENARKLSGLLRTAVPGAQVRALSVLVSPGMSATGPDEGPAYLLVPAGCTPADAVQRSVAEEGNPMGETACRGGAASWESGWSEIIVADPDTARDLYGLDAAAVDLLSQGGVLVRKTSSAGAGGAGRQVSTQGTTSERQQHPGRRAGHPPGRHDVGSAVSDTPMGVRESPNLGAHPCRRLRLRDPTADLGVVDPADCTGAGRLGRAECALRRGTEWATHRRADHGDQRCPRQCRSLLRRSR